MNIKKLLLALFCVGIFISGVAQNPIVQTYYTADLLLWCMTAKFTFTHRTMRI